MHFTRIKLTNWKNFTSVDVQLPERAFLIGPNASGKSNFLDAFRFLRDIAATGGGFQRACEERGGVPKIRCLSARKPPGVSISVELLDDDHTHWLYEIAFVQQTQFPRMPILTSEKVSKNGSLILDRPDEHDHEDKRLLSQTALEQISRNQPFRVVADYMAEIFYLHLVPQIVRGTSGFSSDHQTSPDMFGSRFLEEIATTAKNIQKARLKRIEDALKIAVPQLKELELTRDERGVPHLEAKYEHWRPNAGKQDESQFSDGTLRLIGLLWALQKGSGLLLLEEPELSLHVGIVRRLAPIIFQMQSRAKGTFTRQAFVSTHSAELLSDTGIHPEEILIFYPTGNGTKIVVASDHPDVKELMNQGFPAGEVALPHTETPNIVQLGLGI